MGYQRKFVHRGVHVRVYQKSFMVSGMHDTIFLGAAPDDDQIKRMIDAIQSRGQIPDVEVKAKYRCPICTYGELVEVGFETWQCSRSHCNNEFFYDGEPGQRMLNCRDKPHPRYRLVTKPEVPRPSLWRRLVDAYRRDRLCQCPPPFYPQRDGTCGVCARPER